MCDRFKIKLQQTTHALGILAYNQRLLFDNTADDGGFWIDFCFLKKIQLFRFICFIKTIYRTETDCQTTWKSIEKCYIKNKITEVKVLFYWKKKFNFFTYSQQIQDQRQRRLNSANRAARLVSIIHRGVLRHSKRTGGDRDVV